jgi:hypothetical protein
MTKPVASGPTISLKVRRLEASDVTIDHPPSGLGVRTATP